MSLHTLNIMSMSKGPGTQQESRMVDNSPFFGLKFRWGIPGNQEEGSHRVHVTQGYRNKGDGDC